MDGRVRQHDQDAEHRQRVEDDAADGRPGDAERHVALRVDHLLAGAVGQLEADEVEQQDPGQQHEPARRGLVAAGPEAVHAVLAGVDGHRDGEQAEHQEPGERARRRQPLAVAERRDGRDDRDPDEDQRHHVGHRGGQRVAVVEEDHHPADAGGGQRPADPDRVGDPVQEVVHRPRQVPERQPGPQVRPALLRERGAELGEQQRLGHKEDQREDHHPGERLPAPLGDGGDRVHPDDRADQEEQDVEAAEMSLQRRTLRDGGRGHVDGGH